MAVSVCWVEAAHGLADLLARLVAHRFSLAQGLGPGVRLCSDYFEVAGQLWRLEVYPSGI